MKIIQAFQCEFCAKAKPYASKAACEAHESRCFDNPESWSCATCQHLVRFSAPLKGRPGHVTEVYECQAKVPGEPLTTSCPSWNRRVDE